MLLSKLPFTLISTVILSLLVSSGNKSFNPKSVTALFCPLENNSVRTTVCTRNKIITIVALAKRWGTLTASSLHKYMLLAVWGHISVWQWATGRQQGVTWFAAMRHTLWGASEAARVLAWLQLGRTCTTYVMLMWSAVNCCTSGVLLLLVCVNSIIHAEIMGKLTDTTSVTWQWW